MRAQLAERECNEPSECRGPFMRCGSEVSWPLQEVWPMRPRCGRCVPFRRCVAPPPSGDVL